MTRFVLVRHGQTEWNRAERFRGRADIALDATGLAQAAAAGQRIARRWRPAAIYHSPMQRAMQTAAAIGKATGVPIQSHGGLIDIDFGQWQGLSVGEVQAGWPDLLAAWYEAPGTVQMPDGEGLANVRDRGLATVMELAERHAGATVVLVGHTVINRAILMGILGVENNLFWRLGQDTGAINVFETSPYGLALVTLNDTSHLET